ncbi:hypothetical protein BJ741DRAFT_74123 [Chytriomyces cf. hyalinus JEL632]|nr:hypothetical protein BJ741DRAFT_74123 [Chytriomyces cf. hyalinus JEL632]
MISSPSASVSATISAIVSVAVTTELGTCCCIEALGTSSCDCNRNSKSNARADSYPLPYLMRFRFWLWNCCNWLGASYPNCNSFRHVTQYKRRSAYRPKIPSSQVPCLSSQRRLTFLLKFEDLSSQLLSKNCFSKNWCRCHWRVCKNSVELIHIMLRRRIRR